MLLGEDDVKLCVWLLALTESGSLRHKPQQRAATLCLNWTWKQSFSQRVTQAAIRYLENQTRDPDTEEHTAESSMEEQVINANTVFPCSWPKCY